MAQPLVNRPLLIGALAFIFLVLLGLSLQTFGASVLVGLLLGILGTLATLIVTE